MGGEITNKWRIAGLVILAAFMIDLTVAAAFGSGLGITVGNGGVNPPPPETGTLYFAAYNKDTTHYVAALVTFSSKPSGAPASVLTVANDASPWGALLDVPVGTYVASCTFGATLANEGSVTITLVSGAAVQTPFTFGTGPTPPPTVLFQDGFETGDISKWNGSYLLGGGIGPQASSAQHRTGSYSGLFSISATTSDSRSQVYYDVANLNLVYVRGYFYIAPGSMSAFVGDDRVYLIRLEMGSINTFCSLGVRKSSTTTNTRWAIAYYFTNSSGMSTSTTAYGPDVSSVPLWTKVELLWNKNENTIQAYVNDAQLFNIVTSFTTIPAVSRVSVGAYKLGPTSYATTVYGDDFTVDSVSRIGSSGGLSIMVLPISVGLVTIDVLWIVAIAIGLVLIAVPSLNLKVTRK